MQGSQDWEDACNI